MQIVSLYTLEINAFNYTWVQVHIKMQPFVAVAVSEYVLY